MRADFIHGEAQPAFLDKVLDIAAAVVEAPHLFGRKGEIGDDQLERIALGFEELQLLSPLGFLGIETATDGDHASGLLPSLRPILELGDGVFAIQRPVLQPHQAPLQAFSGEIGDDGVAGVALLQGVQQPAGVETVVAAELQPAAEAGALQPAAQLVQQRQCAGAIGGVAGAEPSSQKVPGLAAKREQWMIAARSPAAAIEAHRAALRPAQASLDVGVDVEGERGPIRESLARPGYQGAVQFQHRMSGGHTQPGEETAERALGENPLQAGELQENGVSAEIREMGLAGAIQHQAIQHRHQHLCGGSFARLGKTGQRGERLGQVELLQEPGEQARAAVAGEPRFGGFDAVAKGCGRRGSSLHLESAFSASECVLSFHSTEQGTSSLFLLPLRARDTSSGVGYA